MVRTSLRRSTLTFSKAATLVLVAASLLAWTSRSPAAEPPADTNGAAITCGAVAQCPTDSSVTITWVTDRNTTAQVEYGPTGGEMKKAWSSHHGLVDANTRVHKVVLENLQPGTTYDCKVVSTEITNFSAYKVQFGETISSKTLQFRTMDPKKGAFSFLVFNDLHDQASTIPELFPAAGPEPYDFVVLNGDIVSHIEKEEQLTAILNQAAESFRSPFFWVRGNHETRGSMARQLADYIGLKDDRYYYSFTHGPVHFLVLDAGEDKIDSHREYSGLVDFATYRRAQAAWLNEEVKSNAFRQAKYRVVLCHMPFPSERAANAERATEPGVFIGMAEAYKNFGETLETAGVDLMISGHMHAAAIIEPEPPRHSYRIVQGGGNKGNARTIIRVQVEKTALEATILKPDGSKVGSCRVEPRR
jgi:predicted phosphodiesterase